MIRQTVLPFKLEKTNDLITPQAHAGLALLGEFAVGLGLKKALVQHRNPGPLDQVRVQWLCLLNDSFVTTEAELSPQPGQGVTDESISQVSTNDMVLSVSHCLGAEVPFHGAYRANSRGS